MVCINIFPSCCMWTVAKLHIGPWFLAPALSWRLQENYKGRSELAQAKIYNGCKYWRGQTAREPPFLELPEAGDEIASKLQHQRDFMHGTWHTEMNVVSFHRHFGLAEKETEVAFCLSAAKTWWCVLSLQGRTTQYHGLPYTHEKTCLFVVKQYCFVPITIKGNLIQLSWYCCMKLDNSASAAVCFCLCVFFIIFLFLSSKASALMKLSFFKKVF